MLRRARYGAKRADRPNRRWLSLDQGWSISSTSGTSAALINLEAPTNVTALTAAVPDDLTVMRIKGDFQTSLTVDASWTLALLVADSNWTPGATFQADADKRMLWSQTYETDHTGVAGATGTFWSPPGFLYVTATASIFAGSPRESTHIDISPRVKLESGKTLFLVAYENAGAATFQTTGRTIRALVQSSRRR